MAKARMLHNKISTSLQVNKLSPPAQLLFTWMIAHADDDGRMRGEAESIKGTVVPLKKWSFKKIKHYLEEMHDAGLIYWWPNLKTEEWFVEFINWGKYQQIKSDRYKPSDLPSLTNNNGSNLETDGIQNGTTSATQSNISELNPTESNKSEYVADKEFLGMEVEKNYTSKFFNPTNEGEVAANEAHIALEPDHPWALKLTYLRALEKGLPPNMFYQYVREIKQDPTIENKGKVFNAKVKEYFEKHGEQQKKSV